jgi:hypothetical protein
MTMPRRWIMPPALAAGLQRLGVAQAGTHDTFLLTAKTSAVAFS